MVKLIGILVALLFWALCFIGLASVLILWDIHQHPMSVFRYLKMLSDLSF